MAGEGALLGPRPACPRASTCRVGSIDPACRPCRPESEPPVPLRGKPCAVTAAPHGPAGGPQGTCEAAVRTGAAWEPHVLLNLNPEPFALGLPYPQRREPWVLGTDKGFFLPVQVGKKRNTLLPLDDQKGRHRLSQPELRPDAKPLWEDCVLHHQGEWGDWGRLRAGGSALPPEMPAPPELDSPMGRRSPRSSSPGLEAPGLARGCLASVSETLGTAPRKPPQSLCVSHRVPGWAQGHRITLLWAAGQALDRASDRCPRSLAWALGPGAALGLWGGRVGHPHLRCDFQLLGTLPPTSHPHSLSATSHPRQPFPMYPEG